MTNVNCAGKAPRAYCPLDEHEAGALARLTDRYAGDLPAVQQRLLVRVIAVLHAAVHHQARRLIPNVPPIADTPGPADELEDRAEDVADALSLLRAAREDLDSLEAALLMAARQPGGKPLLTFRQIAAAIGAESEQAAQGRYSRKVGNLTAVGAEQARAALAEARTPVRKLLSGGAGE